MNYSPQSYDSIYQIQDNLSSTISEIEGISLSTDIEDAQYVLDGIEKQLNATTKNLNKDCSSLKDELSNLMYADLVKNQDIYIELVKAKYEEEMFPFDDWLYNINIPNWSAQKNWLRELYKIADTPEGNVLYLENIMNFYRVANQYNPNNKNEILSWCLEAIDDKDQFFKKEELEEFKKRFLFNNEVNSYLSSLLNKDLIVLDKPQVNNKLNHYINYLLKDKTKNETLLSEVMLFLKSNIEDENTKKVLALFCNDVIELNGYSSFLTIQLSPYFNIQKIEHTTFMKLFEYDKEYNLGLTPSLLKTLKHLQGYHLNRDYNKEKMITTITEMETGYDAHQLDLKLSHKDGQKKDVKIKL